LTELLEKQAAASSTSGVVGSIGIKTPIMPSVKEIKPTITRIILKMVRISATLSLGALENIFTFFKCTKYLYKSKEQFNYSGKCSRAISKIGMALLNPTYSLF
jgi:hypothetical protein